MKAKNNKENGAGDEDDKKPTLNAQQLGYAEKKIQTRD